ncbi:hypothetical protein BC629DRAFT_78047 [Irpex lacteus]|nr:hypothetical protein BC629DRAFT_78047 [Irpex lacteus]
MSSLQESFPVDKEKFTSEYDYDSDSDLEDGPEVAHPEDSSETARSLDLNVVPPKIVPVQGSGELRSRVLFIQDVASTTMKAFIYYLYTGEVNFAPLSSWPHYPPSVSIGSTTTPQVVMRVPEAPLCSPKSMYRLADKYGIADLKEKARLDIKSKLKNDNIVQELRTSFTSTYDDIRNMEVEYACEHSRLLAILPALSDWIKESPRSDNPRSSNTLAAVFERTVTVLHSAATRVGTQVTTQAPLVVARPLSIPSQAPMLTLTPVTTSVRPSRRIF